MQLITIPDWLKKHPIRRGLLLIIVSQAALVLAVVSHDGEMPPSYFTALTAIGFFFGGVLMFVGTLVWLHKRKHRD